MEPQTFDELTRRFARRQSRATAVKLAFATAVGGVFGLSKRGPAHAGSSTCPPEMVPCHGSCVPNSPTQVACSGVCCQPGQTCAGGKCCLAPRACGSICCRADQACFGNACACPSGQTDCSGTCRDLSNDTANCGTCGNV